MLSSRRKILRMFRISITTSGGPRKFLGEEVARLWNLKRPVTGSDFARSPPVLPGYATD